MGLELGWGMGRKGWARKERGREGCRFRGGLGLRVLSWSWGLSSSKGKAYRVECN